MRSAVVAAQCRMDTVSTSYCAGGGPRQPWSSGLAPVSRFQSSVPLSHSSPSLIGLLASMDVKQQKLTLCLDLINTAVLSCWPEVASVISPEKAVFYFFFVPLVKKKKGTETLPEVLRQKGINSNWLKKRENLVVQNMVTTRVTAPLT